MQQKVIASILVQQNALTFQDNSTPRELHDKEWLCQVLNSLAQSESRATTTADQHMLILACSEYLKCIMPMVNIAGLYATQKEFFQEQSVYLAGPSVRDQKLPPRNTPVVVGLPVRDRQSRTSFTYLVALTPQNLDVHYQTVPQTFFRKFQDVIEMIVNAQPLEAIKKHVHEFIKIAEEQPVI